MATWFETHGVAVLLTMRVKDLILRSRESGVSKDEATAIYLNSGVPGTKASNAAQNCER